jgi:Tfp pilus assembly protein PilX
MRHLMRSQDGVALPVASGLLLVVSILVVGFFTVSLRVNDTSVKDRSSKRALAAAEAGLQMAVYRLNQLNATASGNTNSCLTTTWVPQPTGECPGLTESLGNGAEYTYYVSQATPAGAAGCVAIPGVVTSSLDRCITSKGTVNGVSRRVQTRVVQQPTIADFNNVGLVGKSLVYAWNSVKMSSDVGSNLLVQFQNSIEVNDNDSIDVDGKVMLLTGGQYLPGNSVTVEGGTQTTTTPFDMPMPDFEAVESLSVNDNENLVSDLGSAWNATTRRINLTSGEKTIRPGTYHVCNVFLGNSVKLKFSHTGGAATKIYVDSPSRDGSFCAGQADPTGTFGADNSVEINKESGEREELLDIFMYGTTQNDTRTSFSSWCTDLQSPPLEGECKSDFMLDNSVNLYGGVYAPNSTVQAHNSVKIWGSIAADKVRFYNSIEFNLTGPEIDDDPEGAGAAARRGWRECRSEPTTASDPESGCT